MFVTSELLKCCQPAKNIPKAKYALGAFFVCQGFWRHLFSSPEYLKLMVTNRKKVPFHVIRFLYKNRRGPPLAAPTDPQSTHTNICTCASIRS
jgi:hypothetical protein